MRQKILKTQLVALFSLTLINLLYFYLKDYLPDNVFHIDGSTNDIGFLSYYASSILAIIGYFVGPWVVGAFFVFSIFYSFLFSRRDKPVDTLFVFIILAFVCGFSTMLIPYAVGDGLKMVINGAFTPVSLALISFTLFSLFLFGSFEGSTQKLINFFNSIQQDIVNWSRRKKYENQGKKRIKEISHDSVKSDLKRRVRDFLRGSSESIKRSIPNVKVKKSQEVKEEVREEIREEVKQRSETPMIEVSDLEKDETIENINNEGFEEVQESVKREPVPVVSVVKKEESIDEDKKSQVIFNRKKTDAEFFESEDLIDCITRNSANTKNHDPDAGYFEKIIEALEDKFQDFKISAKVINILKGPVVDTFEVELGPGVKVSKIQGIQKDLTLALKGAPVRIVSNMKGKSTIGLEVPRNPREIIYLDEVLRSREFNESNLRLPVAMGKNAYGEPTVVDLARMPHMLVAGSTGAGKSVFINTLLVSLLIKMPPEKMKLILIDPKQLELALYHNLPHLMLPVTTESGTAGTYLLWACQEMERRYSILSDFAVRNIEGFNKKVAKASDEELMKIHKYYEGFENDGYELPYLVIIVDEFADLILTKDGKQIENSICRLAAKARAAGIHLVLATQRPSVDVITGLIKANFPTRVSFRVTSQTDSRTILNTGGAENLLGMGDMLYKHGIDMMRLHSSYVDEDEIEQLVEKLADIPVQFNEKAMEFVENGGEEEDGDVTIIPGNAGQSLAAKDPKYEEAVQVAIDNRKVSASYLQRRLGIGYNRAARIIELMEERGVVGPQQGSKPRKVLIGGGA